MLAALHLSSLTKSPLSDGVRPCSAATHREVERREKVEEARRETERILAQQEAEVQARKAEMERRDK